MLPKRTISIRGKLIDLSMPRVMGILNLTPDSFYDGGRYKDPAGVISRVSKMVNDGADMIDIGAVSSRPGASDITATEEAGRLSVFLPLIRKNFPELIISVDTWRADIAKMAVGEYGADIINDISAGEMDPGMFPAIAEMNVPFIIMHMKGTPKDMQDDPRYDDVINEVTSYLATRAAMLKELGVSDIIVDPGFGFGKTVEHNYILAGRLEELGILELPVLVGFSRKSMISRITRGTADGALAGTVALNAVALLKGANILRVHDVSEAVDTVSVISKLKSSLL